MNNDGELRSKLLDAFQRPTRWEIIGRQDTYQYVYDNSTTVKDVESGLIFELCTYPKVIYYCGMAVNTEPEVVDSFSTMLKEFRQNKAMEQLELAFLGRVRTEEEKREQLAESFKRWKKDIKKGVVDDSETQESTCAEDSGSD